MAMTLGLLSLSPRVRKRGDTLVVKTGLKMAALTLGLSLRRVEIDAASRVVRVESRYGWFAERKRTVPFDRIKAVTYGYADHAPDGYFSLAHDALDVYRVGLRLWTDEEIHLFRFVGDGAWVNDSALPDWFFWNEKIFDLCGTQDRDSLAFVELLCSLIGVRVKPPR